MVVDPIRLNDAAAVDALASARPERTQSRESAVLTPAAHQPAPAPPPEDVNDVKVQWDNENGVIVQITDKKSGELVQQIPSEQVLNVARFIREMLQRLEGNSAPTEADTNRSENHD